MIVPLGSKTVWGKVVGVTNTGGERYYFLVDRHGTVSLMPSNVIEGNNLLDAQDVLDYFRRDRSDERRKLRDRS